MSGRGTESIGRRSRDRRFYSKGEGSAKPVIIHTDLNGPDRRTAGRVDTLSPRMRKAPLTSSVPARTSRVLPLKAVTLLLLVSMVVATSPAGGVRRTADPLTEDRGAPVRVVEASARTPARLPQPQRTGDADRRHFAPGSVPGAGCPPRSSHTCHDRPSGNVSEVAHVRLAHLDLPPPRIPA